MIDVYQTLIRIGDAVTIALIGMLLLGCAAGLLWIKIDSYLLGRRQRRDRARKGGL